MLICYNRKIQLSLCAMVTPNGPAIGKAAPAPTFLSKKIGVLDSICVLQNQNRDETKSRIMEGAGLIFDMESQN